MHRRRPGGRSADPRSLGFGPPLSGTYDVRLQVEVGGGTVATATATRQSPGAVGVTTRTLTVPAEVDPNTYIPVDRIRGAILLACGELDLEWPSCRNVDDVVRRLKGRSGVTVLRYPDAGHYIGVYQPYTSATEAVLTRTGGTLAGTQAANLDLHSKILTLLASL